MSAPITVSLALLAAADDGRITQVRGEDRFVREEWGTANPVTDVTDQVQACLGSVPPVLYLTEDPDGIMFAILTSHGDTALSELRKEAAQ